MQLLRKLNGEFGAIGYRKSSFVNQFGRNSTIANFVGIAQVVDIEQFGCESKTTIMTLAFIGDYLDTHG